MSTIFRVTRRGAAASYLFLIRVKVIPASSGAMSQSLRFSDWAAEKPETTSGLFTESAPRRAPAQQAPPSKLSAPVPEGTSSTAPT
jgi:hypothetical protein